MNDSPTQVIEMMEDLQDQDLDPDDTGIDHPARRDAGDDVHTPMVDPEAEAAVKGAEVQLFDTPQEIPTAPGKFILVYFFLIFASDLVIQIVTAKYVIHAYSGPELDFSMMTHVLMVCHVLKILMNLFYLVVFGRRLPEFRKAYLMDILLSISMLVIYWTITNFLLGNIAASSLKYFALVNMMLTYTRLHISNKINPPYVPGKNYYFYESIQIVLLTFKLENPNVGLSWNLSYGFYWLLSFVLIVAAVALLGLIVVLVIASCLRHQNVQQIPRKFFLGIISIALYTFSNCVFFVIAFLGFKYLMEENKINPHQTTEGANRLLYQTACAQAVVATFNLILLTVIFVLLRKSLLDYIYENKSGEISMHAFSSNLKMNLTQVSGSYFKPGLPDEENPRPRKSLEQCLICNDADAEAVLNPCGHSCLCEPCAKKYLQGKNLCPMCRILIEKVYLICQDPETKEIMARGVININQKN